MSGETTRDEIGRMYNLAARAIGGILLLLLSACQTVQHPVTGFTARQVAVMQAHGFVSIDDHWELGIGNRLLFATDESALLAQQHDRLNELARALVNVGIRGARVEGNTNSTGARQYNRDLSRRRAEVVKEALVTGGMAAAAVHASGMGQSNPIASNRTREGRQENRRVVIIISPIDAGQS